MCHQKSWVGAGGRMNVTLHFPHTQVLLSSAECCLIFIPYNPPVWRLRKLIFIKYASKQNECARLFDRKYWLAPFIMSI